MDDCRKSQHIAAKRLDISPVDTYVLGLDEFEKGFEMFLEVPRLAAKVVLFPDPKELKAAKGRLEGKG